MTSVKQEKDGDRKLYMYKNNPYNASLRQEVIIKRRELTRVALLNREKTQDRRLQDRNSSRSVVTIDTHKARSNGDVLRMAIRDLGWREFPFQRRDHNCDVTWHAISFYDQGEIYSGQVNKFPGSLEIFHKVNLFRWLEFMKSLFPDEYDFFPRTWFLPHQYHDFVSEVRSMNEKKPKHKPMFIVKPSEGSQGDGIYLLCDPQQYNHNNGRYHVVQEYLSDVFILDKFKFDLRVYVVLRSLDPLEFHVCREGLARFSTVPYEQPNSKNMSETFMHLTNYSLNKKSSEFKISDKDDEGSKRKMSAVFKQMERMGYDIGLLWVKIEQMVTKTLIAVVGEMKVEHQAAIPPGKPGPTCFQILGFDILLLKNLDPFLLEVNSNPSLSITEERETPTGGVEYAVSNKDKEIKRKLIRDTLILVAPKNKYTRKRRRHRRRRRREEEDMETDETSSKSQPRPRHRREKAISIRYTDEEDGGQQSSKSIFEESDQKSQKFVRNETCRVFIQGEGEVHFSESGPSSPSHHSHPSSPPTSSSSTKSRKHAVQDTNSDNPDHLPSVFSKLWDEAGDEKMEEDDKDNTAQPQVNSDQSGADSSDDDKEEESCLREIFPSVYGESYTNERILEKLADIFISCLGVKGSMRLGPTMFRLFARKCRLNNKGITNAAVDILYIDMQRKWEYLNPDRTAGLCFLGFVSACYELARRQFYSPCKHTMLEAFVAYCHDNMNSLEQDNAAGRARTQARRKGKARSSLMLFPRSTITSLEEDDKRDVLSSQVRQMTFLEEMTAFMGGVNKKSYLNNSRMYDDLMYN
ncbi:unnamed protein product [Lymnaea stagnalis]|uniref:Uncharacterized protein n=1 Tax=Lymnaea stagnalis TaxID=6523 RepID=A0AAV2IB83_LYMST